MKRLASGDVAAAAQHPADLDRQPIRCLPVVVVPVHDDRSPTEVAGEISLGAEDHPLADAAGRLLNARAARQQGRRGRPKKSGSRVLVCGRPKINKPQSDRTLRAC